MQKGLIYYLYLITLIRYPKITETKESIFNIPVFFVNVRAPAKQIWLITITRLEYKIDFKKAWILTGYITWVGNKIATIKEMTSPIW